MAQHFVKQNIDKVCQFQRSLSRTRSFILNLARNFYIKKGEKRDTGIKMRTSIELEKVRIVSLSSISKNIVIFTYQDVGTAWMPGFWVKRPRGVKKWAFEFLLEFSLDALKWG